MREYLAELRDDRLSSRPWAAGEDKDLILWQVLFHVVNDGTDHRAQAPRLLHDVGVRTVSQDYAFLAYDHPWGARRRRARSPGPGAPPSPSCGAPPAPSGDPG